MSFQEKKAIANILAVGLVVAAYCAYAFGGGRAGLAGPGDMKFWGVTMLLFIGAGVAAAVVTQIVLRILFSIAVAVRERGADEKEIERAVEAADVEDEMDRLIELKSLRVGFCVCGAGFLAALAALALGCPAAVMLNILFLSFHVGALAQGAVSLRYYRRGV